MSSARGAHLNPKPGTADYEFGKKQAAQQLIYYHRLCSAVQKKFTISQSKGVAGFDANGQVDQAITLAVLAGRPLSDITFTEYTEFPLEPIQRIKLEVRQNGAIHHENLKMYHRYLKNDSESREGGILVCASYGREFWSAIINYHAVGTTGNADWDTLLSRLKAEGFSKSIIPCRYFGTEAGCCDGACPFLHDQEAASSTRDAVLNKRRKTFNYKHEPTPHQRAARIRLLLARRAPNGSFEEREEILTEIRKQSHGDRAYCANPECMEPWKQDQETSPLQNCSRCKYTMYCSSECQKKDWKRHKQEPCAPIEELIKNDDLWNPVGTRKGTEYFKTDWGTR